MTRSPFTLWQNIRLWKDAFLDKRTPWFAKAIIIFSILYGVSPLDFVPDFFPAVGQLDDIALIIYAVLTFAKLTKGVREQLSKKHAYETTATAKSHTER